MTKLIPTAKAVSYAYCTSEMANLLGHTDTGCWYIETLQDIHHIGVVAAFKTALEAFTEADKLALPYSRWSFEREAACR